MPTLEGRAGAREPGGRKSAGLDSRLHSVAWVELVSEDREAVVTSVCAKVTGAPVGGRLGLAKLGKHGCS